MRDFNTVSVGKIVSDDYFLSVIMHCREGEQVYFTVMDLQFEDKEKTPEYSAVHLAKL